jgi:ABC-type transport system involved in Fe-S cluster assembly fused permease/ATPase subunit
MPDMVNRGFNLIIGFGAIVAIGITIAIYKIMTMPSMVNTFLAIAITVAVAFCLAVIAGVSYLAVHINHRRKLYHIDTEAKEIALDALRNRYYVTSETFDMDHAKHVLDVLYGHVIEPKAPKAIEKPHKAISSQIPSITDIRDIDYDR